MEGGGAGLQGRRHHHGHRRPLGRGQKSGTYLHTNAQNKALVFQQDLSHSNRWIRHLILPFSLPKQFL